MCDCRKKLLVEFGAMAKSHGKMPGTCLDLFTSEQVGKYKAIWETPKHYEQRAGGGGMGGRLPTLVTAFSGYYQDIT